MQRGDVGGVGDVGHEDHRRGAVGEGGGEAGHHLREGERARGEDVDDGETGRGRETGAAIVKHNVGGTVLCGDLVDAAGRVGRVGEDEDFFPFPGGALGGLATVVMRLFGSAGAFRGFTAANTAAIRLVAAASVLWLLFFRGGDGLDMRALPGVCYALVDSLGNEPVDLCAVAQKLVRELESDAAIALVEDLLHR